MYDRLKGIMRESNVTQLELATLLDISISTLNHKINGKSDFTINEGKKLSVLFDKPLDEIFFNNEIHKMKSNKPA